MLCQLAACQISAFHKEQADPPTEWADPRTRYDFSGTGAVLISAVVKVDGIREPFDAMRAILRLVFSFFALVSIL